jgi:hypothetical protein
MIPGTPVGLTLASGEADIGFQQISEGVVTGAKTWKLRQN